MKYILTLILLLAITMPAMSQLTEDDLNKIKLIINESEARTKAEIQSVKDELKADIGKLKESDAFIKGQLDQIDKRITDARNLGYALIALIGVIIGIPAWRNRKDENDLKKKVETLIQDMETLKQHIL